MHVNIWTDGGARGNPGPAATGIVIKDENEQTLYASGFFIAPTTNNVAEYTAMIQALKAASTLTASSFTLHSDSQLIVRQLNGEYKVKHPEMKTRYQEVQTLCQQFESTEFIHVRRELNKEADALVNQAMDCRGDIGDALGEAPTLTTEVKNDITPNASNNTPIAVSNLKNQITFTKSPKVIKIDVTPDSATGLICLDYNQSLQIPSQGKQTTCCILKGDGLLKNNDATCNIETGSWFAIAQSALATIKSSSESQLIALITQIP